jgi:phosphoribosylanthranilate isomerase
MTWVKICGMTNLEDALIAVDAGADAVGFVFYEKSPRCVTVEAAREIVEKLPGEIEKVGVFVGATAETVIEASNHAGLTVAQIYPVAPDYKIPELSDDFLQKAQCDVIIALPARVLKGPEDGSLGAFYFSTRTRDRVLALLLDSGGAASPGGTGEKFDWEHAAMIREGMNQIGLRLIVAGGLGVGNVGDAIDVFRPWGVDVVSGVEDRPGKKDPEKVRAFVRAVREMDRKVS